MIDDTVARSPATLRTMSAKTVVVATMSRPSNPPRVESADEPAAAEADEFGVDPQPMRTITASAANTQSDLVRRGLTCRRALTVRPRSCSGAAALGGLAGRAQSEQLEPVVIDTEP